jgi:hypothetical protein
VCFDSHVLAECYDEKTRRFVVAQTGMWDEQWTDVPQVCCFAQNSGVRVLYSYSRTNRVALLHARTMDRQDLEFRVKAAIEQFIISYYYYYLLLLYFNKKLH